MAKNTNKLLNSIKVTASIPNDDSRFSDEILLEYAMEELQFTIYPLVISTQEEYFIQSLDVDATGDSISLPEQAYMAKLRDLKGLSGTSEWDIPKLELSEVNKRGGFWIEGRKIKLAPDVEVDKIRLYIYAKHNNLIPVSEVTTISSVDSSLSQVVVNNVPDTITAGSYIDVINTSTGEVTKRKVFVSGIATNTLTLDSVEDIVEGDTVSPEGDTSLLNLPDAVVPLLTQAVANRIYEDLGDTESYRLGKAKYDERANQLLKVMETRVRSKCPVVARRRYRGRF